MKKRHLLKDLSFILIVRVESKERLENLKASTDFLLECFNTNIVILEAASKNNGFLRQFLSPAIDIHFVEDNDIIFHRTKYQNIITKKIQTPFIANWESDVIVDPEQIMTAMNSLRAGIVDFIFPYDGRFLDTGAEPRKAFLETADITKFESAMHKMAAIYTTSACGGGFLADREVYISAGMENENFYGWGPEDGERVKRWEILDKRTMRVPGPLFHLSHPRGINSGFRSEENRKAMLLEYLRICRMSKEELEKEISTWPQMKDVLVENNYI